MVYIAFPTNTKLIMRSQLHLSSFTKRSTACVEQDLGREYSVSIHLLLTLSSFIKCRAVSPSVKNVLHWTCSVTRISYFSTDVVCCQTRHGWQFYLSARLCLHVVCASQFNYCNAKFTTYFRLSYDPQQPRAEPHWLWDLGSRTAVWVWVLSEQDLRKQAAIGWSLSKQ